MKSRAYALSDREPIPSFGDTDKWFVVRTGIVLVGEFNGGQMVQKALVPTFNIAGQNREAIKQEFCRQIDNIFDSYEENKKKQEK